MAYLTKNDYERRENNAMVRNFKNAERLVLNGMTEEQAEAIMMLCSARHELHSNISNLVRSYHCSEAVSLLVSAANAIEESGLDSVPGVPTDMYDIEIDSIEILENLASEGVEDMPDRYEEPEEYQEWYDDNYYRIAQEWEDMNTRIEKYLGEIDKKYNTNTKPTGAQRIF